MNFAQIYPLISVLILAGLLFFPVSRLIGILSVRRLQKRQQRPLSEQEIQHQMRRARIVGVFLALIFSYFFHLNVLQTLR
jgi:uncharacterized paraquat-inducible protein A